MSFASMDVTGRYISHCHGHRFMSLQCITPTIGLVADQTPDHFVSVSIISIHSYGCHPSYDHWIIVTTTTDTTTTHHHHHPPPPPLPTTTTTTTTTTTNHHHHHHMVDHCFLTVHSLYPHCILTVPQCTLTVYSLYPTVLSL